MSYAWIIDRDHLAEQELRNSSGRVEDNSKGVFGPSDAPDWMTSLLRDGATVAYVREHGTKPMELFVFKMFDDDHILYYSGRMITDEGASELACFGPLRDFGMPNAGCTLVEYPGHPDMDCG